MFLSLYTVKTQTNQKDPELDRYQEGKLTFRDIKMTRKESHRTLTGALRACTDIQLFGAVISKNHQYGLVKIPQ